MTDKELKTLKDNLWHAADVLRASAHLAANKYGQPILGLIFLRYADILFKQHKEEIDAEFARLSGTRMEKTRKEIADEGLQHCNSKLYPKNTIMITAHGTVGNLNLLATPMAMNQSCYALNSDVIHSQFFLLFLVKRENQKLKKMASGGVFGTIIVSTFDHVKVVIPDNDLIDRFVMLISSIMDATYKLLEQNNSLTNQRELLLPRLMSGKLEV